MEKRFLNRDIIKYLAILTMLINHIANVFLQEGTLVCEVMKCIGYFTAVTMCYFLVEGYEYTSSRSKYMKRLLIFAIISQVPYTLALYQSGKMLTLNMMFSLLWGFLWMEAQTRMQPGSKKSWTMFTLVLCSAFSDWPVMSLGFVILFWQARHGQRSLFDAYRWAVILYVVYSYIDNFQKMSLFMNLLDIAGGAAAMAASGYMIIQCYNGQRMHYGQQFSKWFFYIFYPAHLAILVLIRMCWTIR